MLLPALIAVLLAGCVKQSDYEILQKENQQLQMRLDQTNEQLRLTQLELSAQQARSEQLLEVQSKLEKSQEQLRQTQAQMDALKVEFDKFRTQRRTAMVGKKYPQLSLEDGKVLRDAQITAITAEEVSFRHDGGFMKVALAKTTDDLRWEACYDPQEEQKAAHDRLLAEGRRLEEKLARDRSTPAPEAATSTVNAATVLRQQLAAQRQQLNAEFQALAAKNPGALQGPVWDSTRPEASPLLNSVSGSRAVLGLSRLQSMRDTINATLRQLQEVDPAAR
ncbi:hypothetical protein [Prosthecobacter sp.]|jgi:kynurenine formamidase|uniref:hypothetical protein n=1 Tax=Prosthecobacter sp. TaxID=1965333 RepID=UPI003784D851